MRSRKFSSNSDLCSKYHREHFGRYITLVLTHVTGVDPTVLSPGAAWKHAARITRQMQGFSRLSPESPVAKHVAQLGGFATDFRNVKIARNRGIVSQPRIEECFKRGKSEAGLGDYQVRTWMAWHHHQTLSLLAAWYLNQETRRGKNQDPRADDSATASTDCQRDRDAPQRQRSIGASPPHHSVATPKRARSALVLPFS